jgi:hypothetical protein
MMAHPPHPRRTKAQRLDEHKSALFEPAAAETTITTMRLVAIGAALVLLHDHHGARAAATESQECAADGTCHKVVPNGNKAQCGVYMAPSTLGEDTSMGIYTGVPLKENDVINFPEIAVPILFRGFDKHPDGTLVSGINAVGFACHERERPLRR